MDNNTIQQIKDTIAQSQSIGIAAPKNPSMDEMAASLALYLLLKNSNKSVSIASPSDPIVEVSNLVGIDKVAKSFEVSGSGSGDLTVSFPYTEGEIEKVSYTLEEGYLNIIVKAAEQGLTFDEKDVEYTRGSAGKLDLVFAIGTANLNDLDVLFDTQNPDTRIINIDNKEANEQYGDINLVSPKLSSISEGIADLALALEMQIDADSAQNMLIGITTETQNFQDPKTSSLAFEMAALLMKKGAARVSSESARRGIKVDDRTQNQPAARPQPQRQAQDSGQRPVEQKRSSEKSFINSQDKKDQDRQRFEENLQKRVTEEQVREKAGNQTGQAAPVRQANQVNQTSSISKNDSVDNDVRSDDDAPTDWLAPKVYKGSSEV